MTVTAPPRQRLLAANGGIWEGLFIRLGTDGREIERFPTLLRVTDANGTVEAALTYLSTGRTVPMRFDQPPPAMQITPEGHWSLGIDRMGPWPWIAELCVVHGERRRRVVLRHGVSALESLTYAREWRPGIDEVSPAPPLVATRQRLDAGHEITSRWIPEPDVEVAITTSGQGSVRVSLAWWPEPDHTCRIERRYAASGLLEPQPQA
ncbi:DUF3598 family protein [Synechococcus sp. CCY 9618]|uniref:DUF3598 family protein n=1 Tax=Synechococcus sp. CCY 9618 TaxID=2815602 RepID=UPI001C247850|nr:DUF3598 family protein [Synechococcus sp. CCY 9618]